MVESQVRLQPNPRLDRPSSGGYFSQIIPSPTTQGVIFSSSGFSPTFSAGSDDNENITTPTLISVQSPPSTGHNNSIPQNTVAIHASMETPDQSQGDSSRPGPTRRRSRSQAVNHTRSSTVRAPQSPPAHGYPASPPQTTDNRHLTPFQGPPSSYNTPTSVPYTHRPDLLTQYTLSTPPGSIPMSHSPPYVYSPTFHPSMDHPRNIHGNYPSMMQSTPMYQYPPPSTVDHASSSVSAYSGSRSPSMYASPSPNTQPHGSSPHLLTNQQQGATISGAYIGPGSYQTMGYPSTSPYPYPSAMYPARYPPSSFPRGYPQSTESEPQGTWFFLPNPSTMPSPQQYENNPSYQNHFPVHFAQMGRSNSRFPVQSSNQQRPTPPYSMPPNPTYHPHFPQTPSPPDGHQVSSQGQHVGYRSHSSPSVSSSSEQIPPGDKAVMRRPYHPNPPAHRSEWVMWAGNVPSDATHDELWKFFNLPPGDSSSVAYHSGVISIFLISRSSCAFVNYDTEVTLLAAIGRFNGVPLRGHDPRCPRMVCRVRKKDDDLKAGVGGQRGMGMHTRWVKQQKEKGRESFNDHHGVSSDDPSLSSSTEQLTSAVSNVSLSSDEDGHPPEKQSSGSGSFTSSNSSFLVRYFPKRYFILKSLSQDDLDLSVERGVWATQKHNEGILDQAYRTSKDVFLIFSVNKSGEFYGYARMTGPVRRGEQTVAWASRRSDSSAGSRSNPPSSRGAAFLVSDGRQVDTSPLPLQSPSSIAPLDSRSQRAKQYESAPPLLGKRYHLPTIETPGATYSLDPRHHFLDGRQEQSRSKFELDRSAPLRAMRRNQGTKSTSESQVVVDSGSPEPDIAEEQLQGQSRQEGWGDCFSVEWISTNRLPFHRARHLRNPWNHDREVKVSRDGTELEPSVGHRLLEEWEKLADLTVPLPGGTGSGKPPVGKKASKQPQASGSAQPPN